MFAEQNSAPLIWLEVCREGNGCWPRFRQVVAERVRLQEPYTAEVTRWREQHGDGGARGLSESALPGQRGNHSTKLSHAREASAEGSIETLVSTRLGGFPTCYTASVRAGTIVACSIRYTLRIVITVDSSLIFIADPRAPAELPSLQKSF